MSLRAIESRTHGNVLEPAAGEADAVLRRQTGTKAHFPNFHNLKIRIAIPMRATSGGMTRNLSIRSAIGCFLWEEPCVA
jgi:hypothetical protein